MGICQSDEKLNGIIDNQSSYQIIYHVSGSMKELTDYQQELNLGPKLGVGMQGVQMEGINFNKKRFCKNQKYHSIARIPQHSFCSVGLNDIQVGCFLSIYAAKLNVSGGQIYKKLIFKDICIRNNKDICLRINKDLTIKPLNPLQITALKECFKKEGTALISKFQQNNDVLKVSKKTTQPVNRLLLSTDYVKKKFGQSSQRYAKSQQTGLLDLNHIGVKINMAQFLKYDWSQLQSLQLDNCEIDDVSWLSFSSGAEYYFPNLKNLYLADNKITTILDLDLYHFPSLKILQLDYSKTQGTNPLTEQSKRNLYNFAIQHPNVQIFCGSIDQSKYNNFNYQNENDEVEKNNDISEISESQMQDFQQYLKKNIRLRNTGWYLFFPPAVNSTRQEPQTIKQSKTSFQKKPKKNVKKEKIKDIISKPTLQKLKKRFQIN